MLYTLYNYSINMANMDKIHEERFKNITAGITGLKNIGNTCYFNSSLQCLGHIPLFRSWITCVDYQKRLDNNNLKKESVVVKLTKLYQIMWSQNCQIDIKAIKDIVGETNDIFKTTTQQDSHELLNTLLDMIHEETKIKLTDEELENKKRNTPEYTPQFMKDFEQVEKEYEKFSEELKLKNKDTYDEYVKIIDNNIKIVTKAVDYWGRHISGQNSIITDLFTGLYYSSLHCDECKNVTGSFEPFTILTLPIKEYGTETLEEALTNFVKEERMIGDNKFYCSNCKKDVDATKKMYIWKSPKVLVIQLKRFKNTNYGNANYNSTSKITTVLKFPFENFDIGPYSPEIYKINNDKYDLCAVSCHHGASWSSGHYVSYCKNSVNETWYKYNDETIHKIENNKLETEIVDSDAYILFYVAK